MASLISPDVKVTDLGKPDKRCKPLTSKVVLSKSSSGNADPILILISSEVLSPTTKL